jgi:tRNA threonylcarbamoyl adenosine modification protein YeaZ
MDHLGDMVNMNSHANKEPAEKAEGTLILSVETSSRIGSAALALGPGLIEEVRFSGPMQHSAEVFPTIDGLLRRHRYTPADIDQIHIAIGPGSFTGLRIAVTMAKAMSLAHAVRIVTVDSLDVVAANLSDAPGGQIDTPDGKIPLPGRIVALFDAKRGQFYASAYRWVVPGPEKSPWDSAEDPGYRIPGPDNGLWQKIAPDRLMTVREIIESFAEPDPIALLGDGLFYQRDKFAPDRTVVLPERYWSPRAANVHRLGYQKALAGRFDDPLALTPFYLRGPEVTLRKKA